MAMLDLHMFFFQDLHQATMASSMLASSFDMLSPTLEILPGRSRGLPPTQLHRSGLLHHSPFLATTSSEELIESVGSVSADTFESDDESEHLSVDSSHYAHRFISSTLRDDDGLVSESRNLVQESSCYEYTKRVTPRLHSKPESKCNSRRESFGRLESRQQSSFHHNGENGSDNESCFSEDERITLLERLEEEGEALAMCNKIAELRLSRSKTPNGCSITMEKDEQMFKRNASSEVS